MDKKPYTFKRRKRRRGDLLTTRNILMLVALSLAAYFALVVYVGDPGASECTGGACESFYSPAAWILAFFIMVGAVMAAGAVIGSVIAFAVRGRRRSLSAIADQMAAAQQADAPRAATESAASKGQDPAIPLPGPQDET